MMSEYISVEECLPIDGQKVVAKFEGVYEGRRVTFWFDTGGGSHFGAIDELDGKGSQPATHWMPLKH